MSGGANFERDETQRRARSPVRRAFFIAILVFATIVSAIAVTALVSGDRQSLEFDYEGFD
jgi:hypothetical protein